MLKEMLAFDSADVKRFTGTETSPKEIVALAIVRAGMCGHRWWSVDEERNWIIKVAPCRVTAAGVRTTPLAVRPTRR
jgi:hypothetical protein